MFVVVEVIRIVYLVLVVDVAGRQVCLRDGQ